jgi:hypothetical protein
MRRLIAAWVLAVLVAGCGTDEKKADPPPEPKPNPEFDKKEMPKGAKKGAGFG